MNCRLQCRQMIKVFLIRLWVLLLLNFTFLIVLSSLIFQLNHLNIWNKCYYKGENESLRPRMFSCVPKMCFNYAFKMSLLQLYTLYSRHINAKVVINIYLFFLFFFKFLFFCFFHWIFSTRLIILQPTSA